MVRVRGTASILEEEAWIWQRPCSETSWRSAKTFEEYSGCHKQIVNKLSRLQLTIGWNCEADRNLTLIVCDINWTVYRMTLKHKHARTVCITICTLYLRAKWHSRFNAARIILSELQLNVQYTSQSITQVSDELLLCYTHLTASFPGQPG